MKPGSQMQSKCKHAMQVHEKTKFFVLFSLDCSCTYLICERYLTKPKLKQKCKKVKIYFSVLPSWKNTLFALLNCA